MAKYKSTAPIGLRVLATIIDYIVFYIIIFILIRYLGESDGEGSYTISGFGTFVIPVFWFAYFPIAESFDGRTMGHAIMGIRVVRVDGKDVDILNTLKRRVLDLVDLSFFGLPAFLMVRSEGRGQRLGDIWARTIVVERVSVNCEHCHASLTISHKEQQRGEFTCPECGTVNQLFKKPEQNYGGNATMARRKLSYALDYLPELYKAQQDYKVALYYMDNQEWGLALKSMIELTQKTGHYFAQDFWIELKDAAQEMGMGNEVNHCRNQLARNTEQLNEILPLGWTAEKNEAGELIYHKSTRVINE